MSQITLQPADTMSFEPAAPTTRFRLRNPLRAGLTSFVVTVVVAGGFVELFNVAVNRSIDSYYDSKIAALATPPNDPAYAKAVELAKTSDADAAGQPGATVSAN